ncbi:MAG TPA: YceI family protein [Gammaproteobacteria bacterium]|nr:YceI family protein [Gammaproteobacteria bacterium]
MNKNFIPPLLTALLGCTGVLLSACQTAPSTVTTTAPATTPLPPLPVEGATHYAINAELSDVRFLVYRAGALASFGHDHVIQAKDVSGDIYLAQDFRASGFSLSLPLAGFVVDAPEARGVEGPDFAKQPSAAAIDGTRKNMLGSALLDAEHFPAVQVRSVKLLGPDWGPDATVRIELHGASRELTVPIAVERCGDTLSVSGAFDLKQSDFGLTPFSALGGGLQVADTLRVRFHLVAQKTP